MHGVIRALKVNDLFKTKLSRKVTFSPCLYLGEGIKPEKLDRIKEKLIRKPLLAKVTLLIIPENSSDQLDILDSAQLVQPWYATHEIKVAGIAGSHDEAVSLVVRITQECLEKRGDCALKEFVKW